MSDIKHFQVDANQVTELSGQSVEVEKSLQNLVEKHLDSFLVVRFLASEYPTGKTHKRRIDTLGIDENGSPVIIEYQRASNQNVINQGLFCLDWLLDHRGEFTLLVQKQLDRTVAESMNARAVAANEDMGVSVKDKVGQYKTFSQFLDQSGTELRDRFESIKSFLLALGDDVQFKRLKYHLAFRRLKNFACVEIHPQSEEILIYCKHPDSITLERDFTRDVRFIGHDGTGDLEIRIKSATDFEKAKALLIKAYEAS